MEKKEIVHAQPRSPWLKDHHQLGESALTCLKGGGPHVDASRVQTVVTKKESENFCVHE